VPKVFTGSTEAYDKPHKPSKRAGNGLENRKTITDRSSLLRPALRAMRFIYRNDATIHQAEIFASAGLKVGGVLNVIEQRRVRDID
jgi:hypothetical protein